MVDKTPMMIMEVGKGPIADLEGVMEEVKELTEAMVPKPQRAKSTRPLKKRKVPFVGPSTNTIPKDNTENHNVPEELAPDAQADQEEHNNKVANIRFEIANIELTKALSKVQNTLKCALSRRKQERVQHDQLREILTAKGSRE